MNAEFEAQIRVPVFVRPPTVKKRIPEGRNLDAIFRRPQAIDHDDIMRMTETKNIALLYPKKQKLAIKKANRTEYYQKDKRGG